MTKQTYGEKLFTIMSFFAACSLFLRTPALHTMHMQQLRMTLLLQAAGTLQTRADQTPADESPDAAPLSQQPPAALAQSATKVAMNHEEDEPTAQPAGAGAATQASSTKRPRSDEQDEAEERPAKRQRTKINDEASQIAKTIRKNHNETFTCPICKKNISGSSGRGTFTQHIRIHTKEKLYKCTHADCGASFSTKQTLINHRQAHEELSSYQAIAQLHASSAGAGAAAAQPMTTVQKPEYTPAEWEKMRIYHPQLHAAILHQYYPEQYAQYYCQKLQ